MLEDSTIGRLHLLSSAKNPGTMPPPHAHRSFRKRLRNGCKIVSVQPRFPKRMLRFKKSAKSPSGAGPGTPIRAPLLAGAITATFGASSRAIMKEMLSDRSRWPPRSRSGLQIDHHNRGIRRVRRDLDGEPWTSRSKSAVGSRSIP